ncbi:MAG: histone deacetylase family protein [Betaproteobacteria bacterium]|nr:histone deacetylase family protein [Betaproteobacteria bacterium]
MTTALITHPDCLKHEMGPHHPECPERLAAVLQGLEQSGLWSGLNKIEAPEATQDALALAHDPDYVSAIFDAAPTSGYAYLDPDTSMNPYSLAAARRAAGAVIEGVDQVMAGEVGNAFCAVRPCGHHATYHRAMGFCIFNNVAVGAMHALETHRLDRVAILDFDVHHGNGTEDIFADDPRVMLCSSFQHPYYPGTGADTLSEHIIPTPLPAQTGGPAFRRAIEQSWVPALRKFAPELIIVSAGFDAHTDDPLAYLNLTEDDYVWVTELICGLASEYSQGRIVSALEGGYSLTALARSSAAHVDALMRA